MSKLHLTKPTLFLLYGFPGSGKTYFARQLTEVIASAHVHGDRIRAELFEQPRFDKQEDEVVCQIMDYMTEEFLKAGMSVVYDINALRIKDRRRIRDLARSSKAHPVLVWFQIDHESAFIRAAKRDRRKADDKHAMPMDRDTYESIVGSMQNPSNIEDYIVISGKHTFSTQKSAVIKRLYEMALLDASSATSKVVKPGLVNLVPHATGGRVDRSRRNIIIR